MKSPIYHELVETCKLPLSLTDQGAVNRNKSNKSNKYRKIIFLDPYPLVLEEVEVVTNVRYNRLSISLPTLKFKIVYLTLTLHYHYEQTK
jgi:hypothetical protein